MLVNKIKELKKEKDAVILAHNYQLPEVQEAADYLGDSLELAKLSKKLTNKVVICCGVMFMAETIKILSPEKKVLLPVLTAGCPLADQITPEQLIELKEKNPEAKVVSYVNSTAKIKALTDVCCTSANAVSVVKNFPAKKIIFVPDRNLGWWVKTNVPEKEIILWNGGCPVHEDFNIDEVFIAKKKYPKAKIMAHPECHKEILQQADFITSTSGMLRIAKQDDAKSYIIATEEGMIYRLKKENPDKEFYSLGINKICKDMKKITLENLYNSLKTENFPIDMPSGIVSAARLSLENMVQYV
ncbi:MAG: quinolinate synthase NadA [Candidatus Omnitrophica bacterium]|nr:quinolinate synthase NadA [Candidatus Omnitrophota bacterium]